MLDDRSSAFSKGTDHSMIGINLKSLLRVGIEVSYDETIAGQAKTETVISVICLYFCGNLQNSK